jgi:hypothetical protein
MAQKQTARARSTEHHARDDDRTAARSEDLHVRSYAHEWAHDVTVEVVTPDGDVAFGADYYLLPGDVESEVDTLPAGEYEVRATLDNDTHETATCRIGPEPDRTAVVEFGNGVLSLTEGLPTR